MGILSDHETLVWINFQQGKTTREIAEEHYHDNWTPAYVSRVLNRARSKIAKILQNHAESHRLDIESLQDYKGLIIGFDYQANSQVYIIFTLELGPVVWYKHNSYAGKLCTECPKELDCTETLNVIKKEYALSLRPDEENLPLTKRSIVLFNKLAAKEIPRYKRNKMEEDPIDF